MLLRVVLVAQAGEDLTNPPGRDLLASSEHTFADLARAIDRAFARWDISHLHEFQLADGTRIASAAEDETDEAALETRSRHWVVCEGALAHPSATSSISAPAGATVAPCYAMLSIRARSWERYRRRSHQCSGGGRFPISTAASLPMLMIRRSNERCGLPGTYQARARDFRGDPAYAYTAVRHSG